MFDPICALSSNVGEVGSRAAGAYMLCCPRSGEQHGDHDSFLAYEWTTAIPLLPTPSFGSVFFSEWWRRRDV
jgi:hypothetical protein